jgi:Ala-tRNA(Pro) deacylase
MPRRARHGACPEHRFKPFVSSPGSATGLSRGGFSHYRKRRSHFAFMTTGAALDMAMSRDELIRFLDGLGIETKTRDHPPLFTVNDSVALRGDIPGGHTKNLFLKDKKGNYFLLTVGEHAVVDLKTIHTRIGASGRVSFGNAEKLQEMLGVSPGAVTIFGLVNDREGQVKAFLDADLMEHDVINAHPLTNEATTTIGRDDLVRFIEATGHEAQILKLSA